MCEERHKSKPTRSLTFSWFSALFACSKTLSTVSPCVCYLQMSNIVFVCLLQLKTHTQNINITQSINQPLSIFVHLSAAQRCSCRLVCLFAQSSSHLSLDLSIHLKIFSLPLTLQKLPWKRFREAMGSRLSAEGLCTRLVNLSTDLIGNEMCELL